MHQAADFVLYALLYHCYLFFHYYQGENRRKAALPVDVLLSMCAAFLHLKEVQ